MKSKSWLTPLVIFLAIIGIGFALTSHTTVIVNGQPLDGMEKALAGFAGPLLAVLFIVVGLALGAHERTFMGLAGLGDLVLTCTDDQSRNRRCGLALARGLSVDEAMREIGQVVEGWHAARVLRGVAHKLKLDLPICETICRILFDGANARDVMRELMASPPQAEFE